MEGFIGTQELTEGYARNAGIIKQQTAGLTHADSVRQPEARGNCLNWVVGHIVASRGNALRQLSEEPVLSEAHAARYKRGSEPVLADGDDLLQLPALLDALDRSQERIAVGLARVTADMLSREVQFGLNTMTVAKALFTNYFHDTYHTGQTEYLRQLVGTNDQVI